MPCSPKLRDHDQGFLFLLPLYRRLAHQGLWACCFTFCRPGKSLRVSHLSAMECCTWLLGKFSFVSNGCCPGQSPPCRASRIRACSPWKCMLLCALPPVILQSVFSVARCGSGNGKKSGHPLPTTTLVIDAFCPLEGEFHREVAWFIIRSYSGESDGRSRSPLNSTFGSSDLL